MYGITQSNPNFVPPMFPHLPGYPGSYVPPWLVPNLPPDMVMPMIPSTPPFFPVEQYPMQQLAVATPPLMPVQNRPFIPQPVLTDPNAMYNLPPTSTRIWHA